MNLAELFHHETQLMAVPAGHAIFKRGDTAEFMYVLLEGTIQIVVGETVVEESGPGTLFGEMSLVDHVPRSATVLAVTDCKLVPIDERRFHFLVVQTPNFATHVMKTMADRLRRTDRILVKAALGQL